MRKRNHVKNSRIGKALSMVLAIMLPLPRHRRIIRFLDEAVSNILIKYSYNTMIRKRVVAKRKNCDSPDKKKPRILLLQPSAFFYHTVMK